MSARLVLARYVLPRSHRPTSIASTAPHGQEGGPRLAALVEESGLSQRQLAVRLGVSEGRVSQILSGGTNLTLRSLAGLAWALGVEFTLRPQPMRDRRGTPAEGDPPPPAWLSELSTRPDGSRVD